MRRTYMAIGVLCCSSLCSIIPLSASNITTEPGPSCRRPGRDISAGLPGLSPWWLLAAVMGEVQIQDFLAFRDIWVCAHRSGRVRMLGLYCVLLYLGLLKFSFHLLGFTVRVTGVHFGIGWRYFASCMNAYVFYCGTGMSHCTFWLYFPADGIEDPRFVSRAYRRMISGNAATPPFCNDGILFFVRVKLKVSDRTFGGDRLLLFLKFDAHVLVEGFLIRLRGLFGLPLCMSVELHG